MTHTRFLPILPFAIFLLAGAAGAAAADPPQRLLTVTGSGEARAAPDQATLSTGVVTQGRSASEALKANAKAMNAVFDTLRAAGIAEKNIRTSNFSVSPRYSQSRAGETQHIVGYEVSNTVTVLVEKLDKVGPAIDALVAAGSNQIDGPSFSIADPDPLLARAREAAVKDAAARAGTLARAAGVSLGPIVSISESSGYAPPQPMYRMAVSAAAPATPIAGGEQSVSASVTIAWEIR
ncbi:MAG TPA: SIMPL domain-containing protein [Rhizomicrobium sp.]|jgi:uncharacterized protein YggE|nr:SIMPL domain-containing protein [Rhizomicrobium sp.]